MGRFRTALRDSAHRSHLWAGRGGEALGCIKDDSGDQGLSNLGEHDDIYQDGAKEGRGNSGGNVGKLRLF